MLNPERSLYKWGPIRALPLFLYYSIESAFKPLNKLFGITYSESFIYFKDGKATWVLDEKNLLDQSDKFVKKNILPKNKFKNYISIWNKRTYSLLQEVNKFQINLSSLSTKRLENEFKKFSKLYYDWFAVTISHELITASLEARLKEELKMYICNQNDLNEAFGVLTAPYNISFYRREQKDLIEILIRKQNKKKALEKHQEKYFWIYNSYARAKIVGVDYFKSEVEKLKEINYKKELKEINNYSKNIFGKKKNILSVYPKVNKRLVFIISTFADLLDARKEVNFKADHVLELFIQEFANRIGVKGDKLKLLLPNELEQISHSYSKNLILNREKRFAMSCSVRGINTFTGQNALKIISRFEKGKIFQNKVIQGTVASRGHKRHFRGVAKRIMKIHEIGKLEEGDILVTTMTSPDFVIGMRKASAIITDVGGVLSHAAIVSREFGIPCIVGTKVATKMIHDGDIVELHCVNGTIRVIKN